MAPRHGLVWDLTSLPLRFDCPGDSADTGTGSGSDSGTGAGDSSDSEPAARVYEAAAAAASELARAIFGPPLTGPVLPTSAPAISLCDSCAGLSTETNITESCGKSGVGCARCCDVPPALLPYAAVPRTLPSPTPQQPQQHQQPQQPQSAGPDASWAALWHRHISVTPLPHWLRRRSPFTAAETEHFALPQSANAAHENWSASAAALLASDPPSAADVSSEASSVATTASAVAMADDCDIVGNGGRVQRTEGEIVAARARQLLRARLLYDCLRTAGTTSTTSATGSAGTSSTGSLGASNTNAIEAWLSGANHTANADATPAAAADVTATAAAAVAALTRLVPAPVAARVRASARALRALPGVRAARAVLVSLALEEDRVDLAAVTVAQQQENNNHINNNGSCCDGESCDRGGLMWAFAWAMLLGLAPAFPGERIAALPVHALAAPPPAAEAAASVGAIAENAAEAVAAVAALGGPRYCLVTAQAQSQALGRWFADRTNAYDCAADIARCCDTTTTSIALPVAAATATANTPPLAKAVSARPFQSMTPLGSRVAHGTLIQCGPGCAADCLAQCGVFRELRNVAPLAGRSAVAEIRNLRELDALLALFEDWLP